MGKWVDGHFQHELALAVDPKRGPRGPGAAATRNAMPRMLLNEVLQQALAAQRSTEQTVVIGICAGYQSLRPVVEQLGLHYVPVDIRDYGKNGQPSFLVSKPQ